MKKRGEEDKLIAESEMCCLPVEGDAGHSTTWVGAEVSQHVRDGLANVCTNAHRGGHEVCTCMSSSA